MRTFDKRILTHFDFIQPIFIIPIIFFSHILIFEANDTLALKQYVYFSIGFVVFLIFFILPIRRFIWVIPFFYWLNICLLFIVDFWGVSRLGAKRWLEVPLINFTIQPSELIKPAFLLMLGYLISQRPPPPNGYKAKDFLYFSFFILLPFILIMKEPDLGTAIVLLLSGYMILFLIGVNKKTWLNIIIILTILSPIFYLSLHDYQKKRISDFLNEKPSYHVKQSIIAIGNGGFYGKTKDEATQTHFKFLPIATSDFIFAYTVERFGFIGAFTLMFLYMLLIMHILSLAHSLKEDYVAKVTAIGIASLIFIYASVNIAMTLGFAPVVGIPLPFFSYGGSSFITFMCFFGILQNLITFRYIESYKL